MTHHFFFFVWKPQSPPSLTLLQWRTVISLITISRNVDTIISISLICPMKLMFLKVTKLCVSGRQTSGCLSASGTVPKYDLILILFFVSGIKQQNKSNICVSVLSLPALKCHFQPRSKLQLLLARLSPPALSLFLLLEAEMFWSSAEEAGPPFCNNL